ncbi:MAG: HAMP domain-containing sensor histidine kinase [Planctomycetota bacterium]|nr:HAMP domain-containing sensor histidine kinase [Planctomycetota bacterium]
MIFRRSASWPITLGVIMIVLLVVLLISWILVTAMAAVEGPDPTLYWTMLAIGTVFLVLLLVGVVLYLFLSIKAVQLSQRQSNFIDSVTHELKSPIASLKLYLQTMTRRQLTTQQTDEFHHSMLEDIERLDSLINHLLDAARVDREPVQVPLEDIDLQALTRQVVGSLSQLYRLPDDAIQLNLQPALVRGRSSDLEMIVRNLVDNAIKYGGDIPQVEVELTSDEHRLVTLRISDNGPGIPAKLRRKIFGRFVRLGSELERKKAGTGLGLFIVRQLVRQLRGKVSVRERTDGPGTVFEVELPGN